VGRFVALWEILSLQPFAQLIPIPLLFVFLTQLPLVQPLQPPVSQKRWLLPSLTLPLPQLHRKTHYLLEDKSQKLKASNPPLLNAKDPSSLFPP